MDPIVRRQTIADLLHRSAKRFPRKLAIVVGGGPQEGHDQDLRQRYAQLFK